MDFINSGNGAENMDGDNLVLDLSSVDESKTGFEAMPKGDYECIVDDCEFGTSQKSGNPMLTWKFKVVEGDFANRVLFFHNVLNKQFGLALLKKALIAIGSEADLAGFNPQKFADEGDAIGLPIRVTVGIQKYQDEKRNNVKDVSASQESGDFMV